MPKIQKPVGTYDVTPAEAAVWSRLEEAVRSMFAACRYGEIRTPVFEYTELFQRGVGESTDIVNKEMYTFEDRGGRSLTLRPEGTAAAVRAYLENGMAKQSPGAVKLWYIAPMFRYERKQKGRFRQHVQYGCEVLGSPGPDIDIEILVMLNRFYRSLGLTELNLKINSVGTAGCRAAHRQTFAAFVKPKLGEFCGDCLHRFETNPLRMFDCKNERCQDLLEGAPYLLDSLSPEAAGHFERVRRGLDGFGIEYEIDPKLVRGLDYYTKTAFEMSYAPLGSQGVLMGGGRYDGLVEYLGGPPTPGIGFGAGMERLILILRETGKLAEFGDEMDVFVATLGERAEEESLRVLTALRDAGLRCDRDYTGKSLKKQLQAASKLGSRYAVIIGDDDIAKRTLILKDMNTGVQSEIAWDADLSELRRAVGGGGTA